MGGFLAGVMYLLFKHGESYVSIKGVMMNNILFLSLLIILTGAVLSSRLYLKAHTNQDVIGGLIVGMAGQIIALRFF
jgi:membrane-associated phospholipid phosphatase